MSTLSFVSGLTNLLELWVDGNPAIPDVRPVLGLTNLYHLVLNASLFTNLPVVAGMSNLTHLEINGNPAWPTFRSSPNSPTSTRSTSATTASAPSRRWFRCRGWEI